MAIWNPWRGCHRKSEGCMHCYIHKGDAKRGVDTSLIIKTDKFDEEVNLMQLRNNIDYRIEPHIISVTDYENNETPFVVEVKNTGIKVA